MIQPITDTREGENKELIHFCFYFLDIIKYTPHLTVLVLCAVWWWLWYNFFKTLFNESRINSLRKCIFQIGFLIHTEFIQVIGEPSELKIFFSKNLKCINIWAKSSSVIIILVRFQCDTLALNLHSWYS